MVESQVTTTTTTATNTTKTIEKHLCVVHERVGESGDTQSESSGITGE